MKNFASSRIQSRQMRMQAHKAMTGTNPGAWCQTWRVMSLDRLVTPPQMDRASAHREYEVLVLKTSSSDKAKLVRPKGAFVSMLRLGVVDGK